MLTGWKLWEHRGEEPLGKDVGKLGGRRDVEDTNISNGDTLVDEAEINLNKFGVHAR
jgi:hypothetical protein